MRRALANPQGGAVRRERRPTPSGAATREIALKRPLGSIKGLIPRKFFYVTAEARDGPRLAEERRGAGVLPRPRT